MMYVSSAPVIWIFTRRAVSPLLSTVSMSSNFRSCVSPLTPVSSERSASAVPVPLTARVITSAPPERDSDSRAAPAAV
nr:MAG: hypothetical protein [Bacteriophage sp.]